MVAASCKTCFDAVQGIRLDLLNDILAGNMPESIKDREGDESDQIYDRFTAADWYYINENCHLVSRDGIIRVNAASEGSRKVPYVFAGYCP